MSASTSACTLSGRADWQRAPKLRPARRPAACRSCTRSHCGQHVCRCLRGMPCPAASRLSSMGCGTAAGDPALPTASCHASWVSASSGSWEASGEVPAGARGRSSCSACRGCPCRLCSSWARRERPSTSPQPRNSAWGASVSMPATPRMPARQRSARRCSAGPPRATSPCSAAGGQSGHTPAPCAPTHCTWKQWKRRHRQMGLAQLPKSSGMWHCGQCSTRATCCESCVRYSMDPSTSASFSFTIFCVGFNVDQPCKATPIANPAPTPPSTFPAMESP
mmetsp:Transcript_32834/g.94115  ORF Transcript_32834/g.94115 Transcript_32834/m.94115 type:complete len:278 (+) Transcript_32834:751-1584(+)